MKVYITKETGGELVIVKVQPEQEAAFLDEHADKVIVSSYSVAGVIEKYSALLNYLASKEE